MSPKTATLLLFLSMCPLGMLLVFHADHREGWLILGGFLGGFGINNWAEWLNWDRRKETNWTPPSTPHGGRNDLHA